MIIMKLAPAALLAVVCSAAPVLAQTPAPAPAQTPAVAPAQTPAAAMPAVQPSPMESDHTNEIALLDRIQKVLDTAVDEQRTKGPTISIDRGLVDELRANVTQIRLSLQAVTTPQSEKK
ncbi:MAG TPA: hypothetical protein VHT95_04825 [Vicinamibacterales bacterium]|nr:hypothetical protein [Vicinamibacterales bacterium]